MTRIIWTGAFPTADSQVPQSEIWFNSSRMASLGHPSLGTSDLCRTTQPHEMSDQKPSALRPEKQSWEQGQKAREPRLNGSTWATKGKQRWSQAVLMPARGAGGRGDSPRSWPK